MLKDNIIVALFIVYSEQLANADGLHPFAISKRKVRTSPDDDRDKFLESASLMVIDLSSGTCSNRGVWRL